MKKFLFIAVALFFATQLSFGQTTVAGKVVDKTKGKPVSGANVWVKEKPNVLTKTNADGTYSIAVPTEGKTIVVEAQGFIKQEKVFGSVKLLDFTLDPVKKSSTGTATP